MVQQAHVQLGLPAAPEQAGGAAFGGPRFPSLPALVSPLLPPTPSFHPSSASLPSCCSALISASAFIHCLSRFAACLPACFLDLFFRTGMLPLSKSTKCSWQSINMGCMPRVLGAVECAGFVLPQAAGFFQASTSCFAIHLCDSGTWSQALTRLAAW